MVDKHEADMPIFRPNKPGIRKILGDLEAEVMEAIWAAGPQAQVTVREIHQALNQQRALAYTTVMTVMGNLAKKNALVVEKDAFAHRYRAPQTKEAFTRSAVGNILDQLLADFAEPTLAHFAETFENDERGQLQALKARIDRERQGEV